MSQTSYSTSNSSISSLILDMSMDIDSGDTNIYPPAYLSENYNKNVFLNNDTLSNHSHSSHSSYSNSTETNSQFSQ